MMKINSSIGILMSLFILAFTSCEKKEQPYALPSQGNTSYTQIEQGSDYSTQVFFSFDNGIVDSNKYAMWHIAISNDIQAPELWLNGGKGVLIYPTDKTNFSDVTSISGISNSDWKYDYPSWRKGESAIGNLISNDYLGKVLLLKVGIAVPKYYKCIITLSEDKTSYIIQSGAIAATQSSTASAVIDTNYNYTYFSFETGIVKPEPPKTDWDIVFTYYRYLYVHYNPDGSDFPYQVSGVLLNPYNTQAAKDTTYAGSFENFSLADAQQLMYTNDRDEIGFDWKIVDINTASYTINPKRIYVVKTQNGEWWKLHFTSYYDSNGQKGSPGFEYVRLQ